MEGIIAGGCLDKMDASGPYLDLGSGNGFPAITIASLCRRARPIILVESSHKKAAFLRALARELSWRDARVDDRHVHSGADLKEFKCRLFSSRGVNLSDLLKEGPIFLEPGGLCVLFGSVGLDESTQRSIGLVSEKEVSLPDRSSSIHILRKR